ncbi:BA75_04237T0 [Komagataella pastoris]|uniref:BA75_04237T0 n=1 Tax=Komagataella pastoris TaxID=4922 RepID=A0A1B2JG04_PICPA|nr:BA75_04237T0 [Komagataella pastoris]
MDSNNPFAQDVEEELSGNAPQQNLTQGPTDIITILENSTINSNSSLNSNSNSHSSLPPTQQPTTAQTGTSVPQIAISPVSGNNTANIADIQQEVTPPLPPRTPPLPAARPAVPLPSPRPTEAPQSTHLDLPEANDLRPPSPAYTPVASPQEMAANELVPDLSLEHPDEPPPPYTEADPGIRHEIFTVPFSATGGDQDTPPLPQRRYNRPSSGPPPDNVPPVPNRPNYQRPAAPPPNVRPQAPPPTNWQRPQSVPQGYPPPGFQPQAPVSPHEFPPPPVRQPGARVTSSAYPGAANVTYSGHSRR